MKRMNQWGKKVVNKYGKFDSTGEWNRYQELMIMEKGKVISKLKRQVPFILIPAVVLHGRKKPAVKYIADFTYYDNGEYIVEDFKGRQTAVFRLKLHLMKHVHGIEIKITG